MKKFITQMAIVGSLAITGVSMTGCTPYERGLVTGATLGVVGSNAFYYRGYNYGYNRNSLYQAGVRNGCNSAHGSWYKNNYRWRNYSNYRSGWRAGYRNCR
ncbi:MAG: hypothetical protein HF962_05735 [Sulfurovum sp.]|nr:hypothetical protein [Sulfurovum sp.]